MNRPWTRNVLWVRIGPSTIREISSMPFRILDRVAYTSQFLQSIDNDPEEAARRGSVLDVLDETFVKVRWDDDPGELREVHSGNLCKVHGDGRLLDAS